MEESRNLSEPNLEPLSTMPLSSADITSDNCPETDKPVVRTLARTTFTLSGNKHKLPEAEASSGQKSKYKSATNRISSELIKFTAECAFSRPPKEEVWRLLDQFSVAEVYRMCNGTVSKGTLGVWKYQMKKGMKPYKDSEDLKRKKWRIKRKQGRFKRNKDNGQSCYTNNVNTDSIEISCL
eukprot:TRINITY_DN2118_c0_g1_i2.p1 TRINITY_DN2118_c0_g1~~TRINITY_DN2118_c0_g1_i2.p1  ORF type:complete len:181 (-),score=5.46 TRINITY_DN2118_c0_g1_i2:44-586(-)